MKAHEVKDFNERVSLITDSFIEYFRQLGVKIPIEREDLSQEIAIFYYQMIEEYNAHISDLSSIDGALYRYRIVRKMNCAILQRIKEINAENLPFSDYVSLDEYPEAVIDEYSVSDIAGRVEYILSTLTPREKLVLKYRFGFFGKEHTLEDCSKIFQVNRERIRQIEAKALRKMRHPSRSRKLKDYL